MAARASATVSFLPQARGAVQKQPQCVTVYQREYKQDVAVITLRNEPSTKAPYRSGQPVVTSWGWATRDEQDFYGYVNHVEPVVEQKQVPMLNIYCIGAVWPMKLVAQRSWQNRTSDSVVAQIAREHLFSCLVKPDSYALPVLTQHGKSDWALLAQLAKRRGYTFYAANTDLRYLPRQMNASERVPLFIKYPSNTYAARGAVTSFTAVKGESVPGQGVKAARVQYAVSDDGTVSMVQSVPPQTSLGGSYVSDPVFSRVEHEHPVHSVADAQANLDGITNYNRFYIGATATLSGDTRVHQGITLRIGGVSDEDDGYWWVSEATHRITLTSYTTSVTLCRDAQGSPVSNPDVATIRAPLTGRPALVGTGSMTNPSLVPLTIYDPVGSTPAVIGSADPVSQVGSFVNRPTASAVTAPSGVIKIDPARLHAWRASSVVMRTAS